MTKIAIGIDIGGTFTDIIFQNKTTGENYKQVKVATTPKEPEKAIIDCLKRELVEDEFENIEQVYHATTIATNAFLGQVNLELPKTALITTKGFRDVLEIGRQRRASLYNLMFERPKPIIPRRYRFEIEERLNADGDVVKEIAEADLTQILEAIDNKEITSVAISLLHSYKNYTHEQQILEFLKEKKRDLYYSASFEVSPEHREFERTSTTAINAVLMPIVSKYVGNLSNSLIKLKIKAPLFIMQSNGGVSRDDLIQQLPVSIIESGPSAGVVASKFFADYLDLMKVLSFDMGGTTAKAGTIVDKRITLTSEYEVGGEVHSGRITKGSGYPARFPFIDLAEISSGGGSIAWVDPGKALQVGPISAGSDPGPACYGQGGSDPTITDANLFLGRLNPKGLLNESFKIYLDKAEKSLKEKIASKLDLSVIESANGILKIANNNMSRILRIVTVERGLDPREFSLLAFGGAGPLHACELAEELDMKEIIIPPSPGLFSAMGLLYTDVKHTFVKSIRQLTQVIDHNFLEEQYKLLKVKGDDILEQEGFTAKTIRHQRFIDARYAGQGFELLIPVTEVNLTSQKCKKEIETIFSKKHEAIYGYTMPNEQIEIVNIRVNSLGIIKKPSLKKIAKGKTKPTEEAQKDEREVFFDELNSFTMTPIYNRSKLLAGNKIVGPAIIEQYDTTTIIPPKWVAIIDLHGLIKLRRK